MYNIICKCYREKIKRLFSTHTIEMASIHVWFPALCRFLNARFHSSILFAVILYEQFFFRSHRLSFFLAFSSSPFSFVFTV